MVRKAASHAKTRRLPGRPAAPDKGDGALRERLLGAALARYVRDGMAGASLRDIAADAGATPALLHYYFGSRDALKVAVIEARVLPALGALQARVLHADSGLAAQIDSLIEAIHDTVATHPWLPALWLREVLMEGGELRRVLLDRRVLQLPAMLATKFAQAQLRGGLREELDPRLAVVSLIGQTLFPLASMPIWRELLPAADIDLDTMKRHARVVLRAGLGLEDGP